jgi:hypothetical protein
MAIWYILWPFGTFCGNLVHFPVLVFSTVIWQNLATLPTSGFQWNHFSDATNFGNAKE